MDLRLFAETYAWIVLVLGYFQVVWPLNRQPVPLPKDMSLWPSVDIFVPTYNEDLNVVKNTIYASLGIDTADWDRVNAFCRDSRIAGKEFRELDCEALDTLQVKLRAIRRKRENKQQ